MVSGGSLIAGQSDREDDTDACPGRKKFQGNKSCQLNPVEIKREETATQWNVGMTYDSLIKLSRHRPDLLIRRNPWHGATRAVIQASLTGVTVFSTIHARAFWGLWRTLLSWGEWGGVTDCPSGICYNVDKGRRCHLFAIQDCQNTPVKKVEPANGRAFM